MERINKINIDDVMRDDELEARHRAAENNKKRKMRLKKRIRNLIILTLLLIFGLYMFSDYSNIKVIDINGNVFYTKEQLLEKAEIDYSMKSVLAPSFLIEKRLENDTLIKSVKIHKSWDGIIRIDIEEEDAIGYYEKDNSIYLMLKDGDDIEIKDSSLLALVPYLNGLNSSQRKLFKKNIQDVNNQNIWMISEVVHYETSYDENMLKLYMQDGHIVYTTMDGLKLLNNYLEMLKALNTTHKCITFVEETNSSYSEKCE